MSPPSTPPEPALAPRTAALVAALRLVPHPEGGWYREVHRSDQQLALPCGPRAASTAIHFVLPEGAMSAWHRVRSEELWIWLDGAPLELHVLDAGAHRARRLGRDLARGETPLEVVPPGALQAAAPAGPGHAWCVCVVAPGFDFADFELPPRAELLAAHPELRELVLRFTR